MSKRLSPAEWAEIVVLYERGEASQQELADRFGVSRQAIGSGLRERDIVMGSKLGDVRAEAEDIAAEKRAIRTREAADFKSRYSKYNSLIGNIVMKKISEAEQPGGAGLASVNAQLVTLRTASQIIKRVREENYALMDIAELDTDDDQLPELGVSVYTDNEIDQITRANEEAYNGAMADKLGGDDDTDDDEA
jgi:transposase-like protein